MVSFSLLLELELLVVELLELLELLELVLLFVDTVLKGEKKKMQKETKINITDYFKI